MPGCAEGMVTEREVVEAAALPPVRPRSTRGRKRTVSEEAESAEEDEVPAGGQAGPAGQARRAVKRRRLPAGSSETQLDDQYEAEGDTTSLDTSSGAESMD